MKFDSEVSVFLDIENEDGEIPEMSEACNGEHGQF